MRALIVEDEPELMSYLSLLLSNAGLVVDRTDTVETALAALRTAPFDIAVVDRRLPDGDGLSIVKAMATAENRPAFLMLTARDAKPDVIEGLNGGADDYLVKPFEPGELIARVRVLARRRHPKRSLVLNAGNLSLDLEGRNASVGAEPLDLRRREADVAVRSGKPTDPELVGKRLRDTPARMYATPSYLARIGNPKTPADLARADFIGFSDDGDRFLLGMQAMGFPIEKRNVRLHTSNHLVLWELVKQGLGIGVIVDEAGDAEPRVVRVLPELWLPPSGFAVTPVLGYWSHPVPVGAQDPREVARAERVRLSDLVDPANRVTVVHPSGYRGPGFQVADMLVWGFTGMLLDRLLSLGGWDQPWERRREVGVPL